MVDFKIKPEPVKIDYGTGSGEETWASQMNTKNNLRTYNNTEITGTTVDGKPFSLRGTTPKDKPQEGFIKQIRVGDMQYKLMDGKVEAKLDFKLKDGKFDDESAKLLQNVIENGSVKLGRIFKTTIRSEYVPDKTSSLSNDDAMKVAMAQALQSPDKFESAHNNLPSPAKPPQNLIG